MHSQVITYYLRNFVNNVVESTLTSPSLAEMVHHHLWVDWKRQHHPPYLALYKVYDAQEAFLELAVTDARSYEDAVYERGLALLRIGVNGALATPEDESYAARAFSGRPFRTCPRCLEPFNQWLDFYGHVKTSHWDSEAM